MTVRTSNNTARNLVLPVTKSSHSRKSRRALTSWPTICLAVLCIIVTAQAQTFQYSRGWTNGKRSGPATSGSPIGLVDLENAYLNPDISDLGFFPSHIQMNMNPQAQARLRTLDYNQYLARKFGVGSSGNLNTRKQPLWFGTIMGMDSSDSSSSTSQTSSGGSASSPSGSSNDF